MPTQLHGAYREFAEQYGSQALRNERKANPILAYYHALDRRWFTALGFSAMCIEGARWIAERSRRQELRRFGALKTARSPHIWVVHGARLMRDGQPEFLVTEIGFSRVANPPVRWRRVAALLDYMYEGEILEFLSETPVDARLREGYPNLVHYGPPADCRATRRLFEEGLEWLDLMALPSTPQIEGTPRLIIDAFERAIQVLVWAKALGREVRRDGEPTLTLLAETMESGRPGRRVRDNWWTARELERQISCRHTIQRSPEFQSERRALQADAQAYRDCEERGVQEFVMNYRDPDGTVRSGQIRLSAVEGLEIVAGGRLLPLTPPRPAFVTNRTGSNDIDDFARNLEFRMHFGFTPINLQGIIRDGLRELAVAGIDTPEVTLPEGWEQLGRVLEGMEWRALVKMADARKLWTEKDRKRLRDNNSKRMRAENTERYPNATHMDVVLKWTLGRRRWWFIESKVEDNVLMLYGIHDDGHGFPEYEWVTLEELLKAEQRGKGYQRADEVCPGAMDGTAPIPMVIQSEGLTI